MRPTTVRRGVAGIAAGAALGACALIGASGPVQAAPGKAAQPAWSGYVASGWAAPVKIEIFEPMIPIPASPQLEIEMGYSVVKSDSASSKARGSWMWPGDPVGDGLKTIVEQMGLPPQLGANGYPVQVNAAWPGDTTSHKDEPMPGMVMRTSAGEKVSSAEVGFSPDSDIADLPKKDTPTTTPPKSSGGLLGLPGLPELPLLGQVVDLTKLPVVSELAELGRSAGKGGLDPMAGIPPELAGIIDFSGYSSKTRTIVSDTNVRTVAQAALGDVRILGGLVRLEGVTAMQESVSNGRTASSAGESTVGGLVVLGQRFSFTSDGFVLAGTPVAGVPADATSALKMLGITLTMPRTTTEDEGLRAAGLAEGLQVEIDAALLSKALRILPLAQLVDLVPDEAKELKSAASLLTGLSPRTVITLGNAGSAVETVTALAPPPMGPTTPDTQSPATPPAKSDPDPTDEPTDTPSADPTSDTGTGTTTTGGGDSTGTSGGGGDVPLPDTTAPGAPSDVISDGGNPQAEEPIVDVAPMAAGLPPLATVPGMLMIMALGLAGVGGIYLRKAGLLALGTGSSCSHGLDSGLPDLRKM